MQIYLSPENQVVLRKISSSIGKIISSAALNHFFRPPYQDAPKCLQFKYLFLISHSICRGDKLGDRQHRAAHEGLNLIILDKYTSPCLHTLSASSIKRKPRKSGVYHSRSINPIWIVPVKQGQAVCGAKPNVIAVQFDLTHNIARQAILSGVIHPVAQAAV